MHHLGKGYGKSALQQLRQFMVCHFLHIDEIVLAVNESNALAYKLYAKNGYLDTGRRVRGSKGQLIVMSYPLSVIHS